MFLTIIFFFSIAVHTINDVDIIYVKNHAIESKLLLYSSYIYIYTYYSHTDYVIIHLL